MQEILRQLVHIGAGFLAFALPWIGVIPLAVLAFVAVMFNAFVLPRSPLAPFLLRDRERESRRFPGIVLYPLTVLILLVAFRSRPEIAAAGWALLAFGDGAASLAGLFCAGPSLPWNKTKSWGGFVAYWVAASSAIMILIPLVAANSHAMGFVVAAAVCTGLLGALVESAPQRLDDNLAAPLIGAVFLLCFLATESRWWVVIDLDWWAVFGLGAIANLVLAGAAVRWRALDRSGAWAGVILGSIIVGFAGWGAFAVLSSFVCIGTVSTRWAFERKLARGLAEDRQGRRRAANAIANGATATACAVFAGLLPESGIFQAAFVTTLAAATADTVESEIGPLTARRTVLITTLREVTPGTDGGVSVAGTMAGALAGLVVVGLGWTAGLVPGMLVLPLGLAALLATVIESLAGATLETRNLLDNQGVNLINTLVAGLLGATIAWLAA